MRTPTGRTPALLAAATLALTAAALGGAAPGEAAVKSPAVKSATLQAAAAGPIQVYGAWHCSNDACTWASVRDMTDFDQKNHWLIDRGDGRPSVNLVVLSFVNPLRLLNGTTDAGDTNGVPNGMTQAVVNYFTGHGIRVMLSIGGITYVNDWDTALSQNPTLLGQKAAALATRLGVGMEIDYENSSGPNLTGLQAFVTAYRAAHPYDATGADPTARLTLDVAAGDRWLSGLDQYATANWLTTSNPVLDYANAMVPSKQPSASGAESNWQEHLTGKPTYSPPIPPLAPAKFTGSLYIAEGNSIRPECTDFSSSVENTTGSWLQSAAPPGPAPHRACWATCSGRPRCRPPAASPPTRRTAARAASAWAPRRTPSRCRCPHCGRAEPTADD
ncbi:glycoside hydrolase family 18 protein [Streptacidiphilus rugosus]|uniref:hypothetical protein n=1 Tax=Streptacidiphilus rugosus TaxID=405783 RepID=UPI000A67B87C|nr:hypothetical protein [Streptacidiphilus rugosus]